MIDDGVLRLAVRDALAREPGLNGDHIGIMAKGGLITLMGHVSAPEDKEKAAVVVTRVLGVTAVVDEIKTAPPPDASIAEAVAQRLSLNVATPPGSLKVHVCQGHVTLRGEVGLHYQVRAAGREARAVPGVVRVSNRIRVAHSVNAVELAEVISTALHRSWFFRHDTVKVETEGGKVILTGTVRSPEERRLAAATAWCAPGVTSVQNDLTLG